jgi:murein DD-endopeptidase MepM/ murein hydrolase activator NlpD
MKGKTLVKILLTSVILAMPQQISNKTNINSTLKTQTIEQKISTSEIYGENPKILGTDYFSFFRLVYLDKNETSDPTSLFELGPKTEEELLEGKILREKLEQKYDSIFREKKSDTISIKWGKIINGYANIPKETFVRWGHAALDIFTAEGNEVLAPFNGVVIASGDYWEGTFVKKEMATWNKKGLGSRMGNGVIIYNPPDKGYLSIAHLKEGILVNAGEIISKGQSIGYVGHSGSASISGHGDHIHVAYKLKTVEGYLRGTDFSNRLPK